MSPGGWTAFCSEELKIKQPQIKTLLSRGSGCKQAASPWKQTVADQTLPRPVVRRHFYKTSGVKLKKGRFR